MGEKYREANFLNDSNEATKEFSRVFVQSLREPLLVLDEDLKIVTASDQFYERFNLSEGEAEGKAVLEINKRYIDIPALKILLEDLIHKKNQVRDFEVACGKNKRTFLVNANKIESGADVENLILLSFKDITREHQAQKIKRKRLKNYKDILAHAPAMICVLRGPEHVFELANKKYYQLVGKRELIGKTVREAIPEAENQGFVDLLDNVYQTGEEYIGKEVPISLQAREGYYSKRFLNFLYQPTTDSEDKIDGIFVHAIDVTEQVISRKKIEKSKEELKHFIDTVPAIIWITEKNGNSAYLNENWYRYTGQSREESAGFGWLNAVHPEDRGQVEETFINAVNQQKTYHKTYRLRTKTGDYRWVMDNGKVRNNVEGIFEGMIGTVVDVHEEKVKEQLVRDREHRIRSIVEEATVATALYTSREMKIELANDAMIRLWGKNRSVIGKTLKEALPELDGQPFHSLLDNVFTTGEIYWGKEDRVDLMIDGKMQTGYFNFTYKPLRNEKGEIYGILNMAMEVTEMVKSRNLLKASEKHFRQMADLMPGKVANTDASGNFIYFNQNWLDYTGLNSEELKEQGWEKFIHPDEKERYNRNWQKSLQDGENFEMELRIKDKEGKYKWHINRAEAVKNEHGDIDMWIGTNTEIHKLKEEEKRKGDFLKMVSHELKTPVTSIKGYVQLLLSLLKKQEKEISSGVPLKPSLERIDHQITRLTRLISEMLDLSRLEENQLELKKVPVDLNKLVEETVQDITYTNTQHKIEIFHDYKCQIFADRDRIGQVLINLITNAIKYSPESQHIEVRIKDKGDDQVEVSITDHGIGIDKINHKKIFKRFYRIGVQSEETYSGFGIGLYLANEIIQRHNGYINVKSKKGEGSVFSFVLNRYTQD